MLGAAADGRATLDEAGLLLGLSPAEVQRAVEVLARLQAARRRRRLRAAGALTLVLTVGALGRAWAQSSCPQTLPFPLLTFCVDTPARADQVNANFGALAQALTSKLGPLDGGAWAFAGTSLNVTGAATVGSALSAASVTAASVTASGTATVGGNATVGGSLSVTGPLQSGCPTAFPVGGGNVNMVDLGATCIMREHNADTARNVKSWTATNEYCVQKGLRLCHPAEVSAAVRLGLIRTYLWSEGDYWAWVDQTASDSNAAGFGGCHVNLNTNQPGFQPGDINCAIDAYATNGSIAGLCCL